MKIIQVWNNLKDNELGKHLKIVGEKLEVLRKKNGMNLRKMTNGNAIIVNLLHQILLILSLKKIYNNKNRI